MEHITGDRLDEQEVLLAAAGAGEEDLVNSGLEETMVTAYHQIREIDRRLGDKADLRTAAFVSAIDKIVVCYEELGIFP